MANRKKAENDILAFAKEIDPSGRTVNIYKQIFKDLDDKGFDDFMIRLRDYGFTPVFISVADGAKLNADGLLALADKMGHDFWDHLVIYDPVLGEAYTTPKRYFNIYDIIRRQSQTQEQGISVSENYNVVDTMTGQTVGSSKGAGYSYPEVLLSISAGNIDQLTEFMKFRGGDNEAGRDMLRTIMQEGKYRMENYEGDTISKSTKLMDVLFKGAHLVGNFIK